MTLRLFIGANNTTHRVDYTLLRDLCGNRFPNGYTITYGEGGWMDGKKLVTEESCIVTVLNYLDGFTEANSCAQYLGSNLGQKQVAVELTHSDISFYDIH